MNNDARGMRGLLARLGIIWITVLIIALVVSTTVAVKLIVFPGNPSATGPLSSPNATQTAVTLVPGTKTVPAGSQTAQTYYVSTTGNDAANCAQSTPCATIMHAASLTQPGDTVEVLSGTYLNPQTIESVNGTPTQPITVAAQGPVTITRQAPASDVVQTQNLLWLHNSSYVTVEGFTLVGMKGRSDYVTADRPFGGELLVENNQNPGAGAGSIISGTTVLHSNNSCFKEEDQQPYVSFLNDTAIDCGQPGSTLDHGIYVTGDHTLIEGMSIMTTTGYGIHAHGPVTGTQILSNTVTGTFYGGILMDVGGGNISYNTVYSSGWAISTVSNVTVTNNILMDNGLQSGHSGMEIASIGNDLIENNTFYHNNGPEIVQSSGTATGPITVENNIFDASPRPSNPYPAIGTVPSGSVVDYNLYQNAILPLNGTASVDGGHSVWADPLFVNPNASPLPDLHISAVSPAVASGTPLGLPYSGTFPDMGAAALCFSCQPSSGVTLSHAASLSSFNAANVTSGTAYYVAPGGDSGTSRCSQTVPCASLLQASRLAHPGDTVVMASGVYTLPQIVEAHGSASAPVTIQASGPVTITRPPFPVAGNSTFTAGLQQQPLLTFSDSQYVNLRGITVVGMKGRSDAPAGPAPYAGEVMIQMPAGIGTHVTVSNTVIQHTLSSCIAADGEVVSLANNQLSDCGATSGSYGIAVGSGNATVTGNTINGSGDDAINATVPPPGSSVTPDLIANNTISGSGAASPCCGAGNGINVSGTNPQITDNTINHSYASGILVGGTGSIVARNIMNGNGINDNQLGNLTISGGTNTTVINNTFYKAATNSEISLGYPNPVVTTAITNNIFIGSSMYDRAIYARSNSSYTTADYNLLNGTAALPVGTDSNHNMLNGAHTLSSVDPKFVQPGTDFHLQSTSPAIGVGLAGVVSSVSLSKDLGGLCFTCASTSATPTVGATATGTAIATGTATGTATVVSTATPSSTPVASATPSPASTNTAVPPSQTPTAVATTTRTPSPVPTSSSTMTPVPPSQTPIPSATWTSTSVPVPTSTTASVVPTASISLSSGSGTYNQTINMTGSNFQPGETVKATLDSMALSSLSPTVVGSNGTFAGTFHVPQISGGSHTVTLFGQSSGLSSHVAFTINPITAASRTSSTAAYTLAGAGFGANESVEAHWSTPSGAVVGSSTTNSLGTFSGTKSLTLSPPVGAAAGTYTVYVIGTTSALSASTTVTLP